MSGRHHVVSRGYQRFFAEGELLRLITKEPVRSKVVGTRDAFVERGFNSIRTPNGVYEELEREWARLENESLPAIREAVEAGDVGAADVHIKVVAAVHIARSYRLRRLYDEAFEQYFHDPLSGMDVPRLQAAFEHDFGRAASYGDIEGVIRERFTELKDTNQVMVERMASMYNTILTDWLAPLHIQAVSIAAPTGMNLVTGDTPVITASEDRMRVNVAFGDAGLVYIPLSPVAGAALTTHLREPVTLYPLDVQLINWLVWRSAHSHLACHPATDWKRSLALAAQFDNAAKEVPARKPTPLGAQARQRVQTSTRSR